MVPLENMFGYANSLRPMSQGRATFTMQFDHYAPVRAAAAHQMRLQQKADAAAAAADGG